MYTNPGPGTIATGTGVLATTGGGSFTVAIIVATVALVGGALLLLRNHWMRTQEQA